MEDDHDLDLQFFRNNPKFPIAIGKFLAATSCVATFSSPLYPQLPISPTPKSRRPGSRGAAGSRWCCTSSPVTTLLCYPTGAPGCPLCATVLLTDSLAAVLWKLIGCSFVLLRLKLICSRPGVKSTCTLNSRVDLDSADGVRAHNFWMYCSRYRIVPARETRREKTTCARKNKVGHCLERPPIKRQTRYPFTCKAAAIVSPCHGFLMHEPHCSLSRRCQFQHALL